MSPTKADFIVVGGGTTGITLATRLSEDPKLRVLVLEAGQDLSTDPRVTTPALWPSLLRTNADWNFTSVPQVNASVYNLYERYSMLEGCLERQDNSVPCR